jgi:hypothetical protein
VPHTWAISEYDACRQYLILLRRVKKAAGCRPSHQLAWIRSKFKWLTIEGYGVRSLWVLPGVRFLVQGMLFQSGQDARRGTAHIASRISEKRKLLPTSPYMQTCKKIASHISVYLGTLDAATLPQEAFRTLRISPSTLRPMDRRRLRAKRKEQGYTIGSLGIVPWDGCGPHRIRRVVMVDQIYQTVDIAAVSASLDMCSFFALGDRKTASSTTVAAWHAVRVHHRCRLLYPPDAPLDLRTAYFTWTHLCLLDGPSFTRAQRRVAAA